MSEIRKTIFIADLHLDKTFPNAVSAFLCFLKSLEKQSIDALYILGDLFEYWVGDDYIDKTSEKIAEGIKQFSQSAPVYFIHGNRDFLLGEIFASRCGMTILEECREIDLYGINTLILHGDTLCTDDMDYINFRKKVRSSNWQEKILRWPIWIRRLKAWQYRHLSKKANQKKSTVIMDVTIGSVISLMRKKGAKQMIHGHTHRPAIHHFNIDDTKVSRMVVGDWYEQGSVLIVSQDKIELRTFSLHEMIS